MANFGYELLEQVGCGGMATVHRARQRGLDGFDRIVAIKQIRSDLDRNPDHISRFMREARILGLLAHPNILQMYELGRRDAGPFIAMEYLEGWSLQRLLGAIASLEMTVPLHVALSLLHELCDALDHVHTRTAANGTPLAIVHRDVSHANLFVTRSGHLKLIDFGIASIAGERADRAGEVAGKLGYMAPETLLGRKRPDARADVFALAVVAWELLTARRLFVGEDDNATINAVLGYDAPRPSQFRPDLPPLLDELLLAALAKDPRRRTQTAALLRSGIESVMRDLDARPSSVTRWIVDSGLSTVLASDQSSFALTTSQVIQIEPGASTTEVTTVDGSAYVEPQDATRPPLPSTPAPTPQPAARSPMRRARTPTPTPTPLAWQLPSQMPASSGSRLAVRVFTAASLVALGVGLAFLNTPHQAVAVTPPASQPSSMPAASQPPAPPHVVVEELPAPTPMPAAAPTVAAVHERSHARPRVERRTTASAVARVQQQPATPAVAPVAVAAVAAAPLPSPPPPPVATPAAASVASPTSSAIRTIPPTRVSLVSGTIARLDPRLLDQAGAEGRKPASAFLCIDTQGHVTSVRLLTARPDWLRDRLVRDLRTFQFTPYVEASTPIPACFVRRIVVADD